MYKHFRVSVRSLLPIDPEKQDEKEKGESPRQLQVSSPPRKKHRIANTIGSFWDSREMKRLFFVQDDVPTDVALFDMINQLEGIVSCRKKLDEGEAIQATQRPMYLCATYHIALNNIHELSFYDCCEKAIKKAKFNDAMKVSIEHVKKRHLKLFTAKNKRYMLTYLHLEEGSRTYENIEKF